MKGQRYYNWLLRGKLVRGIARWVIGLQSGGPGKAVRDKTNTLIWAQVSNGNGDTLTANMVVPEAYTLTAMTALLIAGKVMKGDLKVGYQTPATAYGEGLIMEVEGVERWLV